MDHSNKDKSCKNSNQPCESSGRVFVADSMGHCSENKAQSQSAKAGSGMNTSKTDQQMHSGMHSGMQQNKQGGQAMSGQRDNKNSSMNMNSGAQKQHGQNCASRKGESCSQNNCN